MARPSTLQAPNDDRSQLCAAGGLAVRDPGVARRLALMRRIDELHLELPFAGACMLRDLLRLQGFRVGRQRIARLMRLMGTKRSTASPIPLADTRHIRYSLTCCEDYPSLDPPRSGRWISPTSPWSEASSIWPPSSTGPLAACCLGVCPSPSGGSGTPHSRPAAPIPDVQCMSFVEHVMLSAMPARSQPAGSGLAGYPMRPDPERGCKNSKV